MQYKKLVISEIDFTKSFNLIAKAYEELAVMKMRKIRTSVLVTREYLSKLSQVFLDVKKAYDNQKKDLKIKLKSKGPNLKKSVSVLLSANTSLYGDLIERIYNLFLQNINKDDSDIIIIGRVGRRLYELETKKKNYLYFELPDLEIRLEDLKPVIFHLVKYESIMVYYGKFENIVNQAAVVSNVSGHQPFPSIAKPKGQEESPLGQLFLFEPSLETILAFFEDLIASSLFRQTVHEAQLARLASRIMSTEKAQVNIETQIKKLNFLQTKIERGEQNKKQLERLAGIGLWMR